MRDLAARLGRPRTTVHKTLSGQRRLDPIEFLDWCDALEWEGAFGGHRVRLAALMLPFAIKH